MVKVQRTLQIKDGTLSLGKRKEWKPKTFRVYNHTDNYCSGVVFEISEGFIDDKCKVLDHVLRIQHHQNDTKSSFSINLNHPNSIDRIIDMLKEAKVHATEFTDMMG
jgi:hypothetical protein